MRARTPSIDIAVEAGDWPPPDALQDLARRAVGAAVEALAEGHEESGDGSRSRFAAPDADAELSILFTDDRAMRALNAKWREKDGPTNVLSFPQAPSPFSTAFLQEEGEPQLLGDIVLAAETVAGEAAIAQKPLEDHMAHLIIHGFLHLLGYDHQVEAEAEEMELLERAALSRIGIDDPYAAAQKP